MFGAVWLIVLKLFKLLASTTATASKFHMEFTAT